MTIENWPDEARAKRTTAGAAAGLIASGQRVYVQGGCATPTVLLNALTARWRELHDVEIVHLHSEAPADYVRPEMVGHFRHNALFIGANVREAVQAGRADFTPVMRHETQQRDLLPRKVDILQSMPDVRLDASWMAAIYVAAGSAKADSQQDNATGHP